MQRSVKLTIPLDEALLETIKTYNAISNQHIHYALKHNTYSKKALHKALYHSIRLQFPEFPSALIQCARDHSVEMLKGNGKRKHTLKQPLSGIRFDLRTSKAFLESGVLQLTLIGGRKRFNINIPDYFQRYVGWTVKGCNISVHRNKHVWVNIVVEADTPKPTNEVSVLGVDLGLKNFAVCSDGRQFKANRIRGVKRRFAYLRKRLQACGTQAAKRKLKSLAGRERRFMRDYNHWLSKQLAEGSHTVFALEELKNMRKGRKGKRFNRTRSNWAYLQFRQFLDYKAEGLGKRVVLVDPAYTSQRCSCCGVIRKSNRSKGFFHCVSCGFSSNADFNASVNISQLGSVLVGQAVVNQPIQEGSDGDTTLHFRPTSS